MKKHFFTYLPLILLTMTTTSTFSQKKKVPAPDGNALYYMYEKKDNSICIYDSSNNLVREAHISKDLAFDFFNKDILLNYLGKTGFISNRIFFSKKRINYLAANMHHKSFITPILGFQEKYEINKIGLVKLVSSTEYFENEPPPPAPDPDKKLTEEEVEHIKFNEENKDLIATQNRLDKSYDKESNVYIYTQYEQGKKALELYFTFNDQELVSETLLISTFASNTADERKSITYNKAIYDVEGNLITLKEYNSKNNKQFEELRIEKGQVLFLKMLFENVENNFDLLPVESNTYIYRNQRLICWEEVLYHSKNVLLEHKYKYDEKNRLTEINTTKDKKPYEIDIFKYD